MIHTTRRPGMPDDHFTLLLHDMHQEYTGCWDQRDHAAPYGTCEIFWDTMGVTDTLAEIKGLSEADAETAAYAVMPVFLSQEFIDAEGGPEAITNVWRLTGSREFLARKFDQLFEALDVQDGVSGDDDTFDYWPNTMYMLKEFAKDLAALGAKGPNVNPVDAVYEMAQRVFERTLEHSATRNTEQDLRSLLLQEGYDQWFERG